MAWWATLVIMYVVPFPVYGVFSAAGWVTLPEGGSPLEFVLSVLVMKVGVALGFVLLFRLAQGSLAGRWWPYAAVWWAMYALVEAGQAIGPGYSVMDGVAGVISEAAYFPLCSLVVARILAERGTGPGTRRRAGAGSHR